ncbi:MAG TPA: hypothetical protein VGS12_17725 [Caulobacteraceae bacterium]|nr:hypothetical protein [Caulobacteraceae bacterium]
MPRGLKPVRRRLAGGEVKLYWYHRATGRALKADPVTAEGFAEIAALDERAKVGSALGAILEGSYAQLWEKYRAGPEWRALKPRTRSDYQAVRDWLGEAAKLPIARLTSAKVWGLRDKAAAAKGRRFGNYVVQVLRLTLEWGRRRGLCADNPARAVKTMRKPANAPDVNRAWSATELEAFAADAPAQLLVPFALGLFAGMRQGDALAVTWSAYDGAALRWRASKNGEACVAPVTGIFKTILDAAKGARPPAVQIATTSRGDPWSQSGFRASFFKRLRNLRDGGQVERGCTFHGLRHTIASMARDGSESEFRIAAAIGDRSTAMAATYGRDADRAAAQNSVLEGVQKRFANADWKTGAA